MPPSQYEISRAIAHIKIARYLVARADERGKTHGEKHHFNVVALSELNNALYQLAGEAVDTSIREYDDPTLIKPPAKRSDDIPF